MDTPTTKHPALRVALLLGFAHGPHVHEPDGHELLLPIDASADEAVELFRGWWRATAAVREAVAREEVTA